MEKKLYWRLENNADLSITFFDLETAMESLSIDFEDTDKEDQEETYYTITPVYLTDEEYSQLPEA